MKHARLANQMKDHYQTSSHSRRMQATPLYFSLPPLALIVLFVSGCGGSAGTAADPPPATSFDAAACSHQLHAYEQEIGSRGGQAELRLNLARTDTDDDALANLPLLENVRSLDLSFTKITDAGLAHLARAKNLERLTLIDVPITDAGLEHLYNLPALQSIDLHRTKVSQPARLRLIKHVRQRIDDQPTRR